MRYFHAFLGGTVDFLADGRRIAEDVAKLIRHRHVDSMAVTYETFAWCCWMADIVPPSMLDSDFWNRNAAKMPIK